MTIDEIANGEYEGAPTWIELETWAMQVGVYVVMQARPLSGGIYEVTAPRGGGGCHPTFRGALHLAYHAIVGKK